MNKIISISSQDPAEVFTKLHNAYKRTVLHFAMQFWKDETIAEDIAQEVFLKLWEKQIEFEKIENVKGYLFMMVRNVAINYYRDQKRQQSRTEATRRQTHVTTHDAMLEKEYKKMLRAAVKRLPVQRRKVFALNFELGWNRDKIAEALDISPKTVKSHLKMARANVREFVSEMVA